MPRVSDHHRTQLLQQRLFSRQPPTHAYRPAVAAYPHELSVLHRHAIEQRCVVGSRGAAAARKAAHHEREGVYVNLRRAKVIPRENLWRLEARSAASAELESRSEQVRE